MAPVLRPYHSGANHSDIEKQEVSFERPSDVTVPLAVSRDWPVSIGNALLFKHLLSPSAISTYVAYA